MNDTNEPRDEAVEKELAGVPEDMLDDGADAATSPADELAALKDDLAAAKQDVLYAKAETQNVRRRLDKDMADLREDEKLKGLVFGLEATQRELEKIFGQHGITRIAAMGLPLDPNQHQAMMEVPADVEPGTIVQEMQAGYMIKDRLLRPSMVAVAKKPD
jgi:molecular chaperone GrpE